MEKQQQIKQYYQLSKLIGQKNQSQPQSKNNEQHESNHIGQYYQLLQVNKDSMNMEIIECIKKLSQNGIAYQNQFQENLKVKLLCETLNHEVMTIKIYYGWFSCLITILNIDRKSKTHALDNISSGNYGSIYKYQGQGESVAIKCIEFNDQNFRSQLKNALKQYFILYICSSLQIGPKVKNLAGFNIIIYIDSIDFSMEYCQGEATISKNNGINLKRKLYLLHIFQIVHLDIKPDNIVFNARLNSFVFIDFGLSKMIKQKIGKKRQSKFIGSYEFCSSSMKRSFHTKLSKYVDLYYNDLICLINSLSSLSYLKGQTQENNKFITLNYFSKEQKYKEIKILTLKKMIYDMSYEFVPFNKKLLLQRRELINQNWIQYLSFVKFLPHFMKTSKVNFAKLIFSIKAQFMLQKYIVKHQILTQQKKYLNNIKNKIELYLYQITNSWIEESYHLNNKFQSVQSTSLFNRSYNSLWNIGFDFTLQQLSSTSYQYQKLLLMDQKIISILPKDNYYLQLINFIKINGSSSNLKDITIICQKFLQINKINVVYTNFDQLYKACFKQIWLQTERDFSDNSKYQIYKQTLSTFIILQMISQQEIIKFIPRILKMNFSTLKKFSLLFDCITKIEFIKQKFISSYEYKKLRNFILQILRQYLSNNISKQSNYYLQIIILLNENKNNILQDYQSLVNTYKDKIMDKYQQAQLLDKDIHSYFVYWKCSFYIKKYKKQYSTQNLDTFKSLFHNNVKNQFQYLHFYFFAPQFIFNKYKTTQHFYKLFMQRLGIWSEVKHFRIFLLNLFSQFNQPIKEATQKQSQILEKKQTFNKNSIILIDTMSEIIENRDDFYEYINQIIDSGQSRIPQLKVSLINMIIQRNLNKLFTFSKSYDSHDHLLHTNKLQTEVSMMRKILKHVHLHKLYKREKINKIKLQIDVNLAQSLAKIDCFDCKVFTMIEFLYLEQDYYINYMDFQILLQKKIDVLILFLKNPPKYKNIAAVKLSVLIYYFLQKKRFFNMYELLDLTYAWIKANEFYKLGLQTAKQIGIMTQLLYYFIQAKYGIFEAVYYIINLSKEIMKISLPKMIDSYHRSMFNIFRKQQFHSKNQSFLSNHIMAMDRLLNIIWTIDHAYLIIFLHNFLEIKVKNQVCQRILIRIAKFMRFVLPHAKNLILKRYYGNYLYYYKQKERKRLYIKRLDYKHRDEKLLNLNKIIKRNKSHRFQFSQQNNLLKQKINKYYKKD